MKWLLTRSIQFGHFWKFSRSIARISLTSTFNDCLVLVYLFVLIDSYSDGHLCFGANGLPFELRSIRWTELSPFHSIPFHPHFQWPKTRFHSSLSIISNPWFVSFSLWDEVDSSGDGGESTRLNSPGVNVAESESIQWNVLKGAKNPILNRRQTKRREEKKRNVRE